jgi:hypothetical protein
MKLQWVLVLLLLSATGCLLIPSDTEKGTRVENERPLVSITAGAATSDSSGIDYKVTFQWRGSDDDGVVTRFQYAMDDTTTESAWHDTTGFGTLLKFGASHNTDGASSGIFRDWHTFYLRAVDNEYSVSRVDKRFFNARTIAPTSEITFPKIAAGSIPSLVKTFVIEWKGEDLDSSNPEKVPAYFEYKLIRLRRAFESDADVVDSLLVKNNRFLDTLSAGDKTRWIRVSSKIRQRVLQDLPDTQGEVFVFAIRAVDEAGAVEPNLDNGRNWIKFTVQDRTSRPKVIVSERSLGAHEFPADGLVWGKDTPLDVPSNTPIRFQWVGDAAYYGSKPGNVNYGLDVPDPEDDRYRDPNGIGGWIGWGKWTAMSKPLIFPDTEDGQIHVLYIRMRDAGDLRSSEQLCTIIMRVVAFRFARTALLVDDAVISYGMAGQVQDGIHDAFIDRFIGRIYNYAAEGLDKRSLYTRSYNGVYPEGLNPTETTMVPLSVLAQYQAVLWNYNFVGGRTSGLWYHEHESPPGGVRRDRRLLSSYVGAGGKLFLFGSRPLAAITSRFTGVPGRDYPILPPQVGSTAEFSESNFLWRFLHVRNQVVGITTFNCNEANGHQPWRDGLIACLSANPYYPDLYIDPAKWNTEAVSGCADARASGGIDDFEAVMEGSNIETGYAPHRADAGLDTLYYGVPYNGPVSPPSRWGIGTNGNYQMVVAQRYQSTAADTLRSAAQGRIVLFTFQPYLFQEGPVWDAGTSAINWLMTGRDN